MFPFHPLSFAHCLGRDPRVAIPIARLSPRPRDRDRADVDFNQIHRYCPDVSPSYGSKSSLPQERRRIVHREELARPSARKCALGKSSGSFGGRLVDPLRCPSFSSGMRRIPRERMSSARVAFASRGGQRGGVVCHDFVERRFSGVETLPYHPNREVAIGDDAAELSVVLHQDGENPRYAVARLTYGFTVLYGRKNHWP